MSYYGASTKSKSEFECSECGCYRNDSYCWNCDDAKEELDPMRGVEFPFADNH